MENIFQMKHDTDNRVRALETAMGHLHCLKIFWTSRFANGLK